MIATQNTSAKDPLKFKHLFNKIKHYFILFLTIKYLWIVVHKFGVLGHFSHLDILGHGGIKTFWAQKIRQKKLTKFINISSFYL